MLKFLIDTNVFIPLEPTSPGDVSSHTAATAKLARLSNEGKCELWVHPAQKVDIEQDADCQRRATRLALFGKYPLLKFDLGQVPTSKTNDWVDEQLIVALRQNAVAMLVTEDIRLARKIQRELGNERVVTIAEAIALLEEASADRFQGVPAVERESAYQLDANDPIWASFRDDYPGFDNWLKKCQQEHRQCFVIRDDATRKLDAVTILNEEKADKRGAKTLKICSFKVSDQISGNRIGELLFKAVFGYAKEGGYDSLYITTYPKHATLIGLLIEMGFFEEADYKGTEELQFHKLLKHEVVSDASTEPLEYHVKFGPYGLNLNCEKYVVPIQPQFHQMLFPERQVQLSAFPTREGHANAIRKAYLCHSQHKVLSPGSLLLFYQSGPGASVNCVGVVESCIRSSSQDQITSFVMPRTVYTAEEIESMVQSKEVLAIRFRQCMRDVSPPITRNDLMRAGVFKRAPQSISKVKEGCESWMIQRLA